MSVAPTGLFACVDACALMKEMFVRNQKPCIGILTSGGDCPGLNAVIRATVLSSDRLGYSCIGFLRGYEGLVDPVEYMPLTPVNTSGILTQGGTILGSTNRGRFAATTGEDNRLSIDPDLLAGVAQTVRQLDVCGLICIGGDGSLAIADQFHQFGIPVVGVPKTIDNDLGDTAFTFGFDSAVSAATDALDRLRTTAASHERIMVLEVMGRHAGWIALHAGLAGGADVILIPEISWSFESVCQQIIDRESVGRRDSLLVVAEGATLPTGNMVCRTSINVNEQVKLGGIGQVVAGEIAQRLDRQTRTVVLGHLQRGGSPTTFDRVLATEFGVLAVQMIHEGHFGEMVCYRPPEIESVPIASAIKRLSQVDPNGSAVRTGRGLGISFGDTC